jgi:HPt (histidine-containing phosphotransfer) domain-containing protein
LAHTDRQVLDERLQAFIDQGPLTVYVYRPDKAQRAAHTLKSNGATFGARSSSELCRRLDGLLREGRLDAAPELVGLAEDEWKRVREALAAARRAGALDAR